MIEYVSRNEIAELLGVSRQYVAALHAKGRLPEPDAIQAGRPLWERGKAEAFAATWERARKSPGE